ncbi:Uncharacterized protein TCM_019739 [Theobroma cacao]|uniref:Uncharacterized protein n=1 Tax=Theobroma cacao TaxID=3641 RepID=A0A061EIK7_THECC|nr:Uncharacterized protein TCM_019739 [Theobroma cacao]
MLDCNSWIVDIGATDHIACSLHCFTTYKSIEGIFVKMPNNVRALVTHIGIVQITHTLLLDNVLFVPSFKFNLISVSQLSKLGNHCLIFTNKYCIIQEIHSWTVIGVAEVKTSLYLMQYKLLGKRSQRPVSASAIVTAPAIQFSEWKDAMNTELKALEENGTWTVMPLPFGFQTISCKWIFKVKLHADGTIESVISSSLDLATDVRNHLQKSFKLKDLGTPKYFLGLEIARCKKGILLCQRKYVLDLLNEHGMLGCKPVTTLIDYNCKLTKTDDAEQISDPSKYRQLVGKLIYLTFTRPDITFAAQTLSRFMDKPRETHLHAVYRVLKYLKAALGQGILFPANSSLQLQVYVDSDWARCCDTEKSVTGYAMFLENSLISWKSKKQSVVARRSTEAEYKAMASACCESMWLIFLLQDFEIKHTSAINFYCDNQSSIHICKNPTFHERTKHIVMDCHFIREKVLAGLINPKYRSIEFGFIPTLR